MSTVQDDLWPDDLIAMEVLSPKEILLNQAAALEAKTNSLLTAGIDETTSDDRRILRFVIASPRLSEKLLLFEAHLHRDLEYPVAVIPPDLKLPDFLKREYYQAGVGDIAASLFAARAVTKLEGKVIKNEFVAESPTELKDLLQRLFSSAAVKSLVYSMLAKASHVAA